jgi:hypothetical protein
MKRLVVRAAWALAALVLGGAGPALAGDPVRDLLAADRLACAYLKGITTAFSPQGGVLMKPPLDPNSPGLTIDIIDRAKGRALLEEDDRETPGVLMTAPTGLTVLARDQAGNVTLVTIFAQYSGVSENFLMVSSLHAAGTQPRMSQRYGLCRVVPARESAPPPPAAPAPHQ